MGKPSHTGSTTSRRATRALRRRRRHRPLELPLLLAVWKLAPALAAGNAVVLKPAEQTPVSILLYMRELQDVLPDGVVNVVSGTGPETGAPLVSHDRVPKIGFTGSTEVGQGVMMKAAANTVTDVTLELGGKSPLVIAPDADPETAAEIASDAMFFNGGECCSAGTRLLVHESIKPAFVSAFLDRVADLEMGDPLDESTDLGPQVSRVEVEKTLHFIDLAQQSDATILTGGGTGAQVLAEGVSSNRPSSTTSTTTTRSSSRRFSVPSRSSSNGTTTTR